jgi:hypothetical protein
MPTSYIKGSDSIDINVIRHIRPFDFKLAQGDNEGVIEDALGSLAGTIAAASVGTAQVGELLCLT